MEIRKMGKEEKRESECEEEEDEAIGQCVLNDHLTKQPWTFGSDIKKAWDMLWFQLNTLLLQARDKWIIKAWSD